MNAIRWADDWLLLPQRFALHEPSATAVIADLHLGYSAIRQRLGDAIPARSVADELRPLAEAAEVWTIRQLVVAGDLFERGFDRTLFESFLDGVGQLHIHVLGIVPGNHDRGMEGGERVFVDGFDLAGWHIYHGDIPTDRPQAVMGHWHPAVRIRGRKRPCFLTRDTHLVLPAFSLDAAGVDVDGDRRWAGWARHV